jgi:hypothetical protein
LRIGQALFQVLHLLLQQQHEQAAQATAMRGLRGFAGVEGAHHNRISFVDQRVVQRDLLSGALRHTGLDEVAEAPRSVTLFFYPLPSPPPGGEGAILHSARLKSLSLWGRD